MPDIHSVTPEVVAKLVAKRRVIKQAIVLCTGDMVGNFTMGGNGDPLDAYKRLRDAAKALYLVQGNHDEYNAEVATMTARPAAWTSATSICLAWAALLAPETYPDDTLHKYRPEEYRRRVEAALALEPDILLTHNPPLELEAEGACRGACGAVATEPLPFRPRLHLFGHTNTKPMVVERKSCLALCMNEQIYSWT
eukprot:m.256778 g.256778  ORF g.256778 m.256778 type:complete len:195 (-) comp19175_c0_seq6:152-736(-)